MEMTKVLDKGYVRLIEARGSDLSVVNSARVSYNKEVDVLSDKDERLINFLAREGHMSPFRHASLEFECYVPLMIARQWWKHHVSSSYVDEQNAWNESSRRYVSDDFEFYLPSKDEWRSKPANSKQGSGENVDIHLGEHLTEDLKDYVEEGLWRYERALQNGIAPEQARLFLPANGLYVRFYWHVGLQAVAHFLNLRVAKDSQKEIQDYAKAVEYYVNEHFPISYKALKGEMK